MKILLTGEPHCGKTTLISKLLEDVSHKKGFVTKEIPDPDKPGQRLGFRLIDSEGNTSTLAHVDNLSDIRVSKYGVDVNALEEFIIPLSAFETDQLLYIDEIGQMELYSSKFKDLVNRYIDSPNDFIGTITSVYEDDFVKELKANPAIEFITVAPGNREEIYNSLKDNF